MTQATPHIGEEESKDISLYLFFNKTHKHSIACRNQNKIFGDKDNVYSFQ